MPKMLAGPDTLDGLVAVSFEEPLTRDLVLISPRDRPLSAAARALMAHVRAGLGGRGGG
jgi:DNA-binding transcriptional LysR family regulator